jgi:hypothetical protein
MCERDFKVGSIRYSLAEYRAMDGDSCHSRSRTYDMRCSSRSGWGKASIVSDHDGGSRPEDNAGRPLTRDISVGSASQGAQPPAKAAQCFWATRSAVRGVRSVRRLWSRVVSVAEIDKRRVALALAGEEPADTPGV